MPATPSERTLIGRIAANSRWAREADRSAATAPGRAAFMARFEREVDPDGVLSPEERTVRAGHALDAHMARLALKSSTARRKSREAAQEATEADAELDALGGPR